MCLIVSQTPYGSGRQQWGELVGFKPWLAEASQYTIERDKADPPGRRDLDADRFPTRAVVDQQAGRRLRHAGRTLGSPSRKVEIRGDGAPLAERYLQVATSHLLLLTTGYAVMTTTTCS